MNIIYDMIIAILSVAGVFYIFDNVFLLIHKPIGNITIISSKQDYKITQFIKKNYLHNIEIKYED